MPNLNLLAGMSPELIGLPAKFIEFRQCQIEAIERSLATSKRFVAHALPTGSGKSLVYMAQILYSGMRTAILTSTKGLQTQLEEDFAECGLVSVKGRANFDCLESPGRGAMKWTCEDGASGGCKCNRTKPVSPCPYRRQYEEALKSKIVVTNYAYWCAVHRHGKGLGQFDLLILDEGHAAPDTVCKLMEVRLYPRDLMLCENPAMATKVPQYLEGWRKFATAELPAVTKVCDKFAARAEKSPLSPDELKVYKRWKALRSKLNTLIDMKGHWTVKVDANKNGKDFDVRCYRLMPVWPSDYAESMLFLNIPRVVVVSATLGAKTIELMGVGRNDYEFFDYASVFPPERSPVYTIPTAKLNYKSSDEDVLEVFQRCDDIIEERLDRKGIVHTVSYKRAQEYLDASSYADLMITHDNSPGSAMEASRRFKEAHAPAILVTPSMTTGYDFPYSQCEYQIVMKAPFADLTDPVVNARKEKDKTYYEYAMAQTLIQSCGRGMRAPDDRCETFIVDDTVDRVVKHKPGNFPAWFRDLYQRRELVPPAPMCLAEEVDAGAMMEAECAADLAVEIDMDDGSSSNV